jgi:hypothetical protein
MPFHFPEENIRPNQAAVVQESKPEQSDQSILEGIHRGAFPADTRLPQPTLTVADGHALESQEQPIKGISNRPPHAKYRVVYVNGIRTSEPDAHKAATLVRTSLGVERSECKVLYNPEESTAEAGIKILGSGISSRLGARSEPETVHAICGLLRESLLSSHDRVVLVGHSQGSMVIQNALDRVYDAFHESPKLRRDWQERSNRIEVILYAPLVRTLVPGPEAVSLLNSCDLPARGIGAVQRAVTSSKHYLGYREHRAIKTVIYSPARNQLPELLFDPSKVHESFQLILDSVDFNFRLLAEDPATKEIDSALYANNLAKSILTGRRSDLLHHELIITGCEKFGADFAWRFIRLTTAGPIKDARYLGNFVLEGARLQRLHETAAQR